MLPEASGSSLTLPVMSEPVTIPIKIVVSVVVEGKEPSPSERRPGPMVIPQADGTYEFAS